MLYQNTKNEFNFMTDIYRPLKFRIKSMINTLGCALSVVSLPVSDIFSIINSRAIDSIKNSLENNDPKLIIATSGTTYRQVNP